MHCYKLQVFDDSNATNENVEVENTEPIIGYAMESFFNQFKDVTKEYQVIFDNVWDELALINAMPSFRPFDKKLFSGVLSFRGRAAVAAIQSVLNDRFHHGSNEILLHSEFEFDKDEFHFVLSECNFEKYHVTRCYYNENNAYIVIDDRHCLLITHRMISDTYFGILDLDDGFTHGAFCGVFPKEWNAQFKIWKERFDQSNSESWDDPIITM